MARVTIRTAPLSRIGGSRMVAHAPSHAADGAARAQITLTGRRAAMAGRVADTPHVRTHLPELQTDTAMRGTSRRTPTTAVVIRGPAATTADPWRKPTTAFGQRLVGHSRMDDQATGLVLIPMADPQPKRPAVAHRELGAIHPIGKKSLRVKRV